MNSSPEAKVQQRVRSIYESVGAICCNLSQGYRPGGRRHGTTRQTKGLGDLYVFLPRKRLGFWHETKAPNRLEQLETCSAEKLRAIYRKKQTPEQVMFEYWCQSSGIPYVLGGAAEAWEFIATLGIVPAGFAGERGVAP